MSKALFIIDMQNDFITGALRNEEAIKIVDKIREYADNFDGDIYATKDTHFADYLNTLEGKKLPVPHCIFGTDGWEIVYELNDLPFRKVFNKTTFGCPEVGTIAGLYDEIEFCGVCTDICVISNVLIVKANNPDAKITILEDLCAGTTIENHKNALKSMECCHIDVVNSKDYLKEEEEDKQI